MFNKVSGKRKRADDSTVVEIQWSSDEQAVLPVLGQTKINKPQEQWLASSAISRTCKANVQKYSA